MSQVADSIEVRHDNSVLFEIITKAGIKYLKKHDKRKSKKAGRDVYIEVPIEEIINHKESPYTLK